MSGVLEEQQEKADVHVVGKKRNQNLAQFESLGGIRAHSFQLPNTQVT